MKLSWTKPFCWDVLKETNGNEYKVNDFVWKYHENEWKLIILEQYYHYTLSKKGISNWYLN